MMKQILKKILPLLLVCISATAFAQYPFRDGFSGVPSGQVPPGYVGDIPVRGYHGLDDEKGLASWLKSSNQQDSIITPKVGPVNAKSYLLFFYRWVSDNIYPSEPKLPVKGDELEVFVSTDSINFTSLYLIDSAVHKPNLNFKVVQKYLTDYDGNYVYIKFRCSRGSGSYYMDIDSVQVAGTPLGIQESQMKELKAYPNPAQNVINIEQDKVGGAYMLTDLTGKVIEAQKTIATNTIDVSGIANGNYILLLRTAGYTERKQIVIQR
jgi:hypothetical protein